MKTLIVYYSRTGKVKKAAESALRLYEDAEILEIKDPVKRNGILGALKCGYHAVTKQVIPLVPIEQDLSSYDKIVLCAPVWAGNIASPARSFLINCGPQINSIEYIIMHASEKENYEPILDEMDELCKKARTGARFLISGTVLEPK